MSLGDNQSVLHITLQHPPEDPRFAIEVRLGHNMLDGAWVEREESVFDEEQASHHERRTEVFHPSIDLGTVIVAAFSQLEDEKRGRRTQPWLRSGRRCLSRQVGSGELVTVR